MSPYRSIASTWVSRNVYLALTAFTWLLLLYAGVGWLIVTLRFLRNGVPRDELPLFLTWAFAAATAVQIAGSVAADFAGVFGANLQLRLFPAFTLFAIPLVVTTFRLPARVRSRRRVMQRYLPIVGLLVFAGAAVAYPVYAMVVVPLAFVAAQYASFRRWPFTVRQVATGFGVVVFAGFAFAACLKATNDPLVSQSVDVLFAGRVPGHTVGKPESGSPIRLERIRRATQNGRHTFGRRLPVRKHNGRIVDQWHQRNQCVALSLDQRHHHGTFRADRSRGSRYSQL